MISIRVPIYFLYFQKMILCRLNNKERKHLLDHETLDGGLRTLLVPPYRTALNYTESNEWLVSNFISMGSKKVFRLYHQICHQK